MFNISWYGLTVPEKTLSKRGIYSVNTERVPHVSVSLSDCDPKHHSV